MRDPRHLALCLAALLVACGDDDDDGVPITAPANEWTWVDVPGAACDDGTPTGIGVNLAPESDDVIIFFNGGGACWDYLTCAVLNTSTHGPIGKTQFDALKAGLGGIFDRGDAMNPFRDWNLVWVPYCTGDIHGGDNVVTYTAGAASRTMHHVGHANVLAYLERLAPTFRTPAKLVVSGSSAGGFGAVMNYVPLRERLRPAKSYLIDDSGPLLVGDAIAMSLRDAFYSSWNLGVAADPLCGQACRTDFSAGLTALAERYPADRLALLSSLRDVTIRTYFQLSPEAFEAALLAMAGDVLDETDNFKYFLVSGQTHTMLGSPGAFTSVGTTLWSWLGADVGDQAFTSTRP